MEQNENQYEQLDRTKIAFLIGGLLIILAAIILVIWLFTDRTNASTGEGEAVRITPDRIREISADVSEQVLDTLETEILADRIQKAVSEQLKGEKIYEILSDGDVKISAVGEDELRDIIAVLLADLGISQEGGLTEEQKKYIGLAVEDALREVLAQTGVTQLLTAEEKQRMEDSLRRELSEKMQTYIQSSTGRLTEQDLERLKNSLQVESMIRGEVEKITKQQLEALKAGVIASVKKSIKTPVKGVDYFTDADIKRIQKTVLQAANKELISQVEKLTAKIGEVRSLVDTLTKQIRELKTLDQQKQADIRKLQTSITNINQSIRHINAITEQLTEAVMVSGIHLEKVTGSGSEIQSAPVSAENLTIAQFVDILAGNDQVYTGAIQELNRMIRQLKDENMKQDEAFDKAVKELENSLDDNGKALEDAKAALEESDRQLKNQLDEQTTDFDKKLEEEKKERQEADGKLQEQADAADALTGDPQEAGKIEGDTVFQKIGAIVKILSKDGIGGLFDALQEIGGAQTVEEGMENLHTEVTDARSRVGELEKEKWFSDITLLAQPQQEGGSGYTYQESGSAYVYQIPLLTEEDQIRLEDADTSIVVEFKKPGRLPSNVALSTSGNALLVSFANQPTRNIEIVSIHVYKENRRNEQ
uniref:Uncharacterized protein n=1 Tax=Eubacterium plexicaudatum ASF492 TaxID=1235802 RepID=N2ADQ8_9FIRM